MQHPRRPRATPGLLLTLVLAAAVLSEAFIVPQPRHHPQPQQQQQLQLQQRPSATTTTRMTRAGAAGGDAPQPPRRTSRQQQQQQQQQPLDRGAVLQLLGVGGLGFGLGLGLQSMAAAVPAAFAADGAAVAVAEEMMVGYDSPSRTFTFDYPDSWALAPKPLKTHQEEVNVKSTTVKGFSAGVAVDPVKIDAVAQAGTPAEVGGRIVALEGKKEGVAKVELLDSGADGDYYAFDYAVESTRGKNRYLARATVVDRKLVVFTVQVPIAGYGEQARLINKMLASFRAPMP